MFNNCGGEFSPFVVTKVAERQCRYSKPFASVIATKKDEDEDVIDKTLYFYFSLFCIFSTLIMLIETGAMYTVSVYFFQLLFFFMPGILFYVLIIKITISSIVIGLKNSYFPLIH